LIPRYSLFYRDYEIGYGVVSIIFVASAVGFIAAAFIVDPLQHRLGRSKTFMVSLALMSVSYIMIAVRPPYAVVAIA
jgi:MFS family permease